MKAGFFALVCLVASSNSWADHEIAWRVSPATDGAATQPTLADRRHASTLARESIDLLGKHDFPSGEAKLREALAIVPEKAVWHYNLACILAVRGHPDAAMGSLEKATDLGFTDFSTLEAQPSFKSLHALPRYAQLLSRKQDICHKAAERAVVELKQQFGDSYLYQVDEEQKLIFATNTDQATLDSLKISLHEQAKSQEQDLFAHKPDEFIRIVLPSLADYHKLIHQRGILGIYEDETRTLLAQRLGQVMTHEFTHALHAADQRAAGQEHPIWLREGLASMYEAGEFENGKLVPHDNFRLGFVQSASRRNALIPLDKVLMLRMQDFIGSPNLAYGESSSLMLYLYEKNLLRNFYDIYKSSYHADPTGQAALEMSTGMTLAELQKAWTDWMLARKSPQMTTAPGGPYLGVHFGDAVDGLKIAMVLPTGAAATAGLKTGDVIVGFDAHEVRDYASFAPLLAAHKAGEEVAIKVRRDGKYLNVAVVLGQR